MSTLSKFESRIQFAKAIFTPNHSQLMQEISSQPESERLQAIVGKAKYRITALGFIAFAQKELSPQDKRGIIELVGLIGSIDDTLDTSLGKEQAQTLNPEELQAWLMMQPVVFDTKENIGTQLSHTLDAFPGDKKENLLHFLHEATIAHTTLLHIDTPAFEDIEEYRQATTGGYVNLVGQLMGIGEDEMPQFIHGNTAVQLLDDMADIIGDYKEQTPNPILAKAKEFNENEIVDRYAYDMPLRRSRIGKLHRVILSVQRTRNLYEEMPWTKKWCQEQLAVHYQVLTSTQQHVLQGIAKLIFK